MYIYMCIYVYMYICIYIYMYRYISARNIAFRKLPSPAFRTSECAMALTFQNFCQIIQMVVGPPQTKVTITVQVDLFCPRTRSLLRPLLPSY